MQQKGGFNVCVLPNLCQILSKTATFSTYDETMIIKKHKSLGVESFSNELFTSKLRIIKCSQHSLKLWQSLEDRLIDKVVELINCD